MIPKWYKKSINLVFNYFSEFSEHSQLLSQSLVGHFLLFSSQDIYQKIIGNEKKERVENHESANKGGFWQMMPIVILKTVKP